MSDLENRVYEITSDEGTIDVVDHGEYGDALDWLDPAQGGLETFWIANVYAATPEAKFYAASVSIVDGPISSVEFNDDFKGRHFLSALASLQPNVARVDLFALPSRDCLGSYAIRDGEILRAARR